MEQQLDTIIQKENIVQFIWKKRKLIGLVTLIGAFCSLVISFFIPPQYLSTAIVFPSATSSVSFSEQRNASSSSMDFGAEEQAEQMLQILQSAQIRDRIVKEFGLIKHYDIKETEQYKYYKLCEEYEAHFSFTRTRYGSIQIDVLDEDASKAAAMANKIVYLIDTVKNEMIKARTVPAYEINRREKEIIEQDIKIILDRLDTLSKIGVVTAEARGRLFQAYNEAKGKEDKRFFRNQIDVNIKYGAEFEGLSIMRNDKMAKIAEFETAYNQAESDANANFSHKFIVELAVKADKKEKPKKSVIVLISSLSTLLFMIFLLLLKERIQELRKVS
jgi:capsular polysaccharide biosynthesis protein